MSVLDLPGLDERGDAVKAEFCILASFTDPAHPAVQDLSISEDRALAYAAHFLPGLYTSDLVYEEGEDVFDMELRFLAGMAVDLDEPAPIEHLHPVISAHRVFWATGYGASPAAREDVDGLLDLLDWSTPMFAGELCLAKLFVGGVPTGEQIALADPLGELGWESYHDHLVRELLEATR